MGVFCHSYTVGDARDQIFPKKKKKIALSKAAVSGRKEKSRHVQEPPRKDGKCMHLFKNKIKTWRTGPSLQKIKAIPELRKNIGNGSRF